MFLELNRISGVNNLTDGYHTIFYEWSRHISKQLGKEKVNNKPFVLLKC